MAGTIIENQATAVWLNAENGRQEVIRSNAVEVETLPQEGAILSIDQDAFIVPGQQVSFAHQLVNTGNTPIDLALMAVNVSGDAYDLLNLALIDDLNGNGVADDGEPKITPVDFVSLPIAGVAHFVVVGIVPTSAPGNSIAQLELTAQSLSGVVQLLNTDTVRIIGDSDAVLQKQLLTSDPQPGELLSYELRATNRGEVSPDGVIVTVDGTAATTPLILIRDDIPPNTVYDSVVESGQGQLLFRLLGSADLDLVSVAPIDRRQVVSVVYGFEQLLRGESLAITLNVRVSNNVSGQVINQAAIGSADGAGGVLFNDSNMVAADFPNRPPTITAYDNNQFNAPINSSRSGVPLYFETTASQCNLNASVAETHKITLIAFSGDREIVTARETGTNTGIFRVQPPIPTTADTVTVGNNVVELGFSDEVIASVTECGETAATSIEYVPSGTVYDSRSNLPVGDARVVLIDVTGAGNGGNAGGPARVLAADRVTVLSNEVLTDESGVFRFPRVLSSTYRIEVFSPLTADYIFPSVVQPPNQPPGRLIPEAMLGELIGPSFGGLIELTEAGPVVLDIPLDRPATGLGVAVTVNEEEVDIGDLVRSTVTITNFSDVDLSNGRLRLVLPEGFRLRNGSVLINGNRVDDPEIVDGVLILPLGTLISGEEVPADIVTFLMQAGAGARGGEVAVQVEADGAAAVQSHSRPIRLRLEQFHGYIFGKTFMDCDRDRQQGVEEPGVPGVRIYLEDGSYVVTDAEGKYNFYGISPGLHVLKIDRTTLPHGSTMLTLDNRMAGDAHSRFVDLKRHEFHKANFAVGFCSDRVKNEVDRRRAEGQVFAGELQNAIEQTFTVDSRRPGNIDSRRLPSSSSDDSRPPNYRPVSGAAAQENDVLDPAVNVLPGDIAAPFESDRAPITPVRETNADPARAVEAANAAGNTAAPVQSGEPVEIDFESLDNKTAFIGLKDGQIMSIPRITVRAKGNSDGNLALSLNGEPVSKKKIGLRKRDASRKLLLLEWVSLTLEPGPNVLTLSLVDPFGNLRNPQSVTVMAPGKLAKILVNVKDDGVPADGNTVATIEVLLQDKDGVPVTTAIPLTIETDRGRWLEEDAQPREPGTQVIIRGGRVELKMAAPVEAGDAKIRISSGIQAGHAELAFLPPLRDMLVVGLIEGEFGRRSSGARDLSFERDLENFADTSDRKRTGARSAVFAKGRVGKQTLLTLSYDSEKDKDFRLFRDIRPDEFYPVYGDAAERGFDARSSSKLFLRLDRRQSYLQYGDFSSAQRSQAVSLGRFNRSLTGVVHHFEKGRAEVNTFVSRGNSTQQVVQIRGRGVSGPYRLGTSDISENSERIELVTLDREALQARGMTSEADIEESRDLGTSIELNTRTLVRFVDYVVDYDTGEIIFRKAVSSLDSNLNPVLIRVTFERAGNGERFWVGGVNAQLKLSEGIEIGAGYARDENPDGKYQIASANVTLRLSERTQLTTEYAVSESEREKQATGNTAKGDAYRVELEHRGERLQGRVYFANTDVEFDNPNAGFGQGRREMGARLSLAIGDRTRLVSEWLRSRDLSNDNKREGTSVSLERSLTDNMQLEFGYRHSKDSGSASARNADSVRLKISGQLPKFRRTSVFVEAEQDLQNSSKRVLALGMEYQMHDRGRLYARHEFISSLEGRFALDSGDRRNNTVVGVDTSYMENGQLFSEYRLRDSSSGADTEAAIGLRNHWELSEGLRLNASMERTETLRGESNSDSTSVALGVEYTANPLWKGTARLEFRDSSSGNSWFSSLGVATKLNRDWTFLGRNTLSLQDRAGATSVENRLQFGFALRPADTDRWSALMRYELNLRDNKPEIESSTSPRDRRVQHLWSLSYNFQPRQSFFIAGHYSGKSVSERFGGESNISANAHLFSVRLGHYISERWDLGLLGSAYYTDDFREQRYGLGAEVGFLVHSNLWVTAGYNWFGYEDPDIAEADYRQEGVYLRMRFKFDERLFDDLGRTANTDVYDNNGTY